MKYFLLLLSFSLTIVACSWVEENADQATASAIDTQKASARGLTTLSDSQEVVTSGDLDSFLTKYKIASTSAQQIKDLITQRQKTSAIREVHNATKLSLPKAKALVDTMFHLAHQEPLP